VIREARARPQVVFTPTPGEIAVARRTDVPVLVTARSDSERITYASHIHYGGVRGRARFVTLRPGLSGGATILTGTPHERDSIDLDDLLTAFYHARHGTLFIDHIDRLNPLGQEWLLLTLEHQRLHLCPDMGIPAGTVRVISGADHSVLDDVTAGRFSARLLYRLNLIHVDRTPQNTAVRG
jgi:DNA-binding NtrC family response regulator